jgi:hypothetical protein
MIKPPKTNSFVRLLPVFLSLLGFGSVQAHAAAVCGPGNHWIDSCPAGTETLPIIMRFGLSTNGDSVTDVEVQFDGTITVQRNDPVVGNPTTDPGHLNYIQTEILSMNLVGTSAYGNGWFFRAGVSEGLSPSTGFIRETTNAAVGTNRFDLVFQIDGSPYGTLHHDGTFFFSAPIDRLPPVGTVYKHLGGPFGTDFALLDTGDNQVLRLTDLFGTDYVTQGRPEFTIVPLPSALGLLAVGIFGLFGARFRRRA